MNYLKTGKEWYEDMPDHIKSLYLENITSENLYIVSNMYFEHFVNFLSESFVWSETPEGYDYWLEVSQFNFYNV